MAIVFRQLFDAPTSTFTYLLADPESKQAVLIDTVFEQHQRDLALVRELGLELVMTLDTHVHADHVTGAYLMKRAVGSAILLSARAGATNVDHPLEDGEEIHVGALTLEARATPGHTSGCMTFVCHGKKLVFTGDALLIRGAGRTDFQQGDAHTLFHSVRTKILSLPGDYAIYPGHDYSGRTMTTVAEENEHNPRLGAQVREEDFTVYMAHLGLPHPKKLEIAVPANLACGRPEGDAPRADEGSAFGPAVRTYAGVWQVEPEWLHLHPGDALVVDVREIAEIESAPLGSLAGSVLLPLSELRKRASDLPRDRPLVTVCPAGARSAMAATILEAQGFTRVANLRGGLFGWRDLGFPMASGAPPAV